jgi:hypothetical protein
LSAIDMLATASSVVDSQHLLAVRILLDNVVVLTEAKSTFYIWDIKIHYQPHLNCDEGQKSYFALDIVTPSGHVEQLQFSPSSHFDEYRQASLEFVRDKLYGQMRRRLLSSTINIETVELKFTRSGPTPGMKYCLSNRYDKYDCESFVLMEVMLGHLSKCNICHHRSESKKTKVANYDNERLAKILVLGSSSAWVFCNHGNIRYVGQTKDDGNLFCEGLRHNSINARVVPGASAYGLLNKDSFSNASASFIDVIPRKFKTVTDDHRLMVTTNVEHNEDNDDDDDDDDDDTYDVVAVMLGEVDRSSTIWKKASSSHCYDGRDHYNNYDDDDDDDDDDEEDDDDDFRYCSSRPLDRTSMRKYTEKSVEHLFRFIIDNVLPFQPPHILIMSPPLPTPAASFLNVNEGERGDVRGGGGGGDTVGGGGGGRRRRRRGSGASSTVVSRSQYEETVLTLKFNHLLEKQCLDNETNKQWCKMVDISSSDLLNLNTGLLDSFFNPEDEELDIHLHLERSLFFWRRALVKSGVLKWCSFN